MRMNAQMKQIDRYLADLTKYLTRLEHDRVGDVVAEVRSHILDACEAADAEMGSVDIDGLLSGFGEPRLLAARYTEHVLTGAPLPRGMHAIQVIKRNAKKGLTVGMFVYGYGVALGIVVLAIVKLLFPSQLGVWSAAGGESLTISLFGAPTDQGAELWGYWLVPIMLGIAAVLAYFTTRVVSELKRAE